MNFKNVIFSISFIIVSTLAMDPPAKQAHVAPPITKTLPILGAQFVKYTSDGKHLVFSAATKIYVTDTQDYNIQWNPALASSDCNVTDVSAKNEIASIGNGQPVIIWDIATQKNRNLSEDTKEAWCPLFNNAGDQLVTPHWFVPPVTRDLVEIFDMKDSSKSTAQTPQRTQPSAFWNRNDNNEICVISGGIGKVQRVEIWDRKADKLRDIADVPNLCSVQWNNDGKLVMGITDCFAVCDPKEAIKFSYYDLQGRKIDAPPAPSENMPQPGNLNFLSGEEMRLFAAAFYGKIYYCDFDDPSQSFDFAPVNNPSNNACSIAIAPNQNQLAATNYSNNVEIFDISQLNKHPKAIEEIKKEVKQAKVSKFWCQQQ